MFDKHIKITLHIKTKRGLTISYERLNTHNSTYNLDEKVDFVSNVSSFINIYKSFKICDL